jgi:hypothetical protein
MVQSQNPPFGNLYKKIKIAQYSLHYAWKQENNKEMQNQKQRQVDYKKSPGFVPVIPLVPHLYASNKQRSRSGNSELQEEHFDL